MTYTKMIRDETVRLMAKRMIGEHCSVELICSVTGLSVKEVHQIAAQLENADEPLEDKNGNGQRSNQE